MSNASHLRAGLAASLLAASLLFSTPLSTPARAFLTIQREHLTPEEVELVRDNQELDKRTAIFAKAVERRLQALASTPATPSKKEQKESEKWGALPTSTRAQFLSDIAKILDEAITNIDDAALHNDKSPLIPKSLRQLASACNRFLPQLTSMRESAQEGAERDWLEKAVENAEEIIGAAGKLSAEAEKKH